MRLSPLGRYATTTKLALEVSLQVGATAVLKAQDLLRAMVLLRSLAEHRDVHSEEDRARDYGLAYLQQSSTLAVDLSDQRERWAAFQRLADTDPVTRARAGGVSVAETSLTLEDTGSGNRYVRCIWIAAYVRQQAGPGAADETLRALRRVGWDQPGSEGRIKATSPTSTATLQWAFLQVPPNWEDR